MDRFTTTTQAGLLLLASRYPLDRHVREAMSIAWGGRVCQIQKLGDFPYHMRFQRLDGELLVDMFARNTLIHSSTAADYPDWGDRVIQYLDQSKAP